MQSIFLSRLAATSVMPLMAAGGWAGYSYYDQPSQSSQNGCIVLTTDTISTTSYEPQVANLQQFFIGRGYLRGNPNGYLDQPTEMALSRFQADSGIPVTGRVDSQTRTIIQQVSCPQYQYQGPYPDYYPNNQYPNNGQLSIQGVDAPQQLAAGQSGAWSVHVLGWDQHQGGTLHYSVVWGDENYGARSADSYYPAASVEGSGTFTHTYTQPGTYTPVFTVRDDYGHSARVSATTYVGSGAYPAYGNGYCDGYSRNCSNNTYTSNTYGTYQPSSYGTNGTYSCTDYYDRTCYANGRYVGPDFGGTGYTYNGPGDTCYYLNGQWQGSCSGRTAYSSPTSGVDYSCYYDRACLARMNGTTY